MVRERWQLISAGSAAYLFWSIQNLSLSLSAFAASRIISRLNSWLALTILFVRWWLHWATIHKQTCPQPKGIAILHQQVPDWDCHSPESFNSGSVDIAIWWDVEDQVVAVMFWAMQRGATRLDPLACWSLEPMAQVCKQLPSAGSSSIRSVWSYRVWFVLTSLIWLFRERLSLAALGICWPCSFTCSLRGRVRMCGVWKVSSTVEIIFIYYWSFDVADRDIDWRWHVRCDWRFGLRQH